MMESSSPLVLRAVIVCGVTWPGVRWIANWLDVTLLIVVCATCRTASTSIVPVWVTELSSSCCALTVACRASASTCCLRASYRFVAMLIDM